jgi:hypothetical protein
LDQISKSQGENTVSFLSQVETSNQERRSLEPGSYGTGKEPGLKILSYIDKASKLDKSGAMRHSFLVSATRPSREAVAAGKNGNGKSPAVGFDIPDYDGTAFLSITLHEMWLNAEATALAFTEASRNKEGVIQADYVANAISEGETTQESIDRAMAHFRQVATDKCIAANTPEEGLEEAVDTQYKKEMTQISIKVGQFLTLQDWAGVERSLQFDPSKLVNVEFSGKITESDMPSKDGTKPSEVKAIYSRKKA